MTNLPGLIYCYRSSKCVSLVILCAITRVLWEINCVCLFKSIWLIDGTYKKVG